MSTLSVSNLKNAASATNNLVLAADGSVSILGGAVSPYTGMRNRIIDGAMTIDQRNAGASVATSSGTSVFFVDRWSGLYSQTSKFTAQQNGGAASTPEGFTNYLRIASTSAYSVGASEQFNLIQVIEGFNIADLGWGAANAQAITLSFRVRSSLTGTFGGCLQNTGKARAYPFTYTISAANTWETKTITVAGDTTGTWNTTNGAGLYINFGLGVGSTVSGTAGAWTGAGNIFGATGATSVVGTSGATFDVSGVQLEKGSVATPFEFRSIGQELALCERYYFQVTASNASGFGNGVSTSSTASDILTKFNVSMRSAPTTAINSGLYITDCITYNLAISSIAGQQNNVGYARTQLTHTAGATLAKYALLSTLSTTGLISFSAEL